MSNRRRSNRRKPKDSRPRRKRKGHHHHLGEIAKITRGEYEDSSSDDSSDVPDHFHRRRDSRVEDFQFAKFHAYYSSQDDEENSSEEEDSDAYDSSDDNNFGSYRGKGRPQKQNTFKFNDDQNLNEEIESEEDEARRHTRYSTELRGTYQYAADDDVAKVRKDVTKAVIDVNKPSIYNDMKTLLHVACEHGADDVVDLLINELNADLFVTDRTEQNALHICAKSGRTGMIDTMIESLEDEPGLKKKLINSENRYGMTPLMIATDFGRKRVARYLLREDGINIKTKAYGGVHLGRNCIQIAQNNIDDYAGTTRGENTVTILDLLVQKKNELRQGGGGGRSRSSSTNNNKNSNNSRKLQSGKGKAIFLRAIGHFSK